jgi:hypothetical protein
MQTDVVTTFLDYVTEQLGTNYWEADDRLSDLCVYLVDLSPMRLRWSITPVIGVTEDHIRRLGRDTVADLVRQEISLRQDVPASVIVLADTNVRFLHYLAKEPHWAAILDGCTAQDIMHHPNPKRAFLSSLRSNIPLRFLSPYEPNQPVSGSQFFGRSSEQNLIMSQPSRSFAIEGGRRIGKTSLLIEIKRMLLTRMLPKEQAKRVVWYDFWGYGQRSIVEPPEQLFFEDLVRHFGEGYPKLVRDDFASYFPRFVARMKANHGGPIIFLLDEVDDLIQQERQTGYPLLSLLKRTAHIGDCRVVMAGFRDLSKELTQHSTSLTFCQRVRLHNLTHDQTMALLRDPMASLGVGIQREVFPRILNDTGGHPQLVQLYGQALIEILDETRERTVTMAHVREVKRAGRLYDSLVETLIDNTSELEFALVHSLVLQP